jgi:3-oxoacyl-(acyl-carrier-protein) synthase
MPDAIITGTGLGCLEDTEKFLSSIYTGNEKLLNPTPFIQSTHNTVAGAIALSIKCHNYNITYTHRGFSFESALEDTLLQLAENPSLNILAGGFDEITANVYSITKRLGLWNKGGIPGEGVAFFMMSGEKGAGDMSKLSAVSSFYKPKGLPAIKNQIHKFLQDADKTLENIDLVILGINGDFRSDKVYYQLMDSTFKKLPCIDFKHLCGEYDTSSSFALWLASAILKQQHIPAQLLQGNKIPSAINNILIYNHLRGVNHSLYLLEQC